MHEHRLAAAGGWEGGREGKGGGCCLVESGCGFGGGVDRREGDDGGGEWTGEKSKKIGRCLMTEDRQERKGRKGC